MRGVEQVTTPPEGLEAEMLEFFAGRQYLVDNSKARRELGIAHRPLEAGLREYLAWEIDQLGMDLQIEQPAAP
jgi:dihydroflavonol-4-reductase